MSKLSIVGEVMTKFGPPSPAEEVASLLRRRGIDLDPERLDETLAAQRAREKREFADYRDGIETLALAARKAKRLCELEEYAWRSRPNSDNLQRAKAAQIARKRAEDALLEAVNHDRELYRAVLRPA
jgi:hypothetical protein